MYQYVIKFSKEGYICYTSHLDMLRFFKRAFKKAGISLAYSSGFNPHPKMGFAQPLSLGYSSVSEYLEFETIKDYKPSTLKSKLQQQMPDGITILDCGESKDQKKSLAARTESAEYIIAIPLEKSLEKNMEQLCEDFLAQSEIFVWKKQKKSKKEKEVDIRSQIRFMNFVSSGTNLFITAVLDSGSQSNLSPELLISAITRFFGITTDRSEMSVMRTKIHFYN